MSSEARSTSSPTASTSAGDFPPRYQGKPMLIIIDNYALSVIGRLSPDKEASIQRIVQHTFGGDGA